MIQETHEPSPHRCFQAQFQLPPPINATSAIWRFHLNKCILLSKSTLQFNCS